MEEHQDRAMETGRHRKTEVQGPLARSLEDQQGFEGVSEETPLVLGHQSCSLGGLVILKLHTFQSHLKRKQAGCPKTPSIRCPLTLFAYFLLP